MNSLLIGFLIGLAFGILSAAFAIRKTGKLPASIESVFDSALSVASSVLSNAGTRQAAIDAAKALIESVIGSIPLRGIMTEIIEMAIPALSQMISSMASEKELSTARVQDRKEYRAILKKCITDFQERKKGIL